jgi:hypothetical protein
MARIKDDKVVAVGLPDSLELTETDRLHALGWRQVKGLPKPSDGSGYEYTHPFTYDADEDAVYGTWQQTDVIDRINDAKAKGIREQRDTLLDESDFAVMPDSPVADVEPWKAYRQALRDVPQQAGFPNDIEWPEEPSTE